MLHIFSRNCGSEFIYNYVKVSRLQLDEVRRKSFAELPYDRYSVSTFLFIITSVLVSKASVGIVSC